jgi:lipid A 3-O-deacylase
LALRLGASPWFAEAGVDLSITSSLYETAGKRFSTRFNFGNHLGAGRNFGARREHEVVPRVEHFSNAGIKHPNPGENFFQVRYAYRFRQVHRRTPA